MSHDRIIIQRKQERESFNAWFVHKVCTEQDYNLRIKLIFTI